MSKLTDAEMNAEQATKYLMMIRGISEASVKDNSESFGNLFVKAIDFILSERAELLEDAERWRAVRKRLCDVWDIDEGSATIMLLRGLGRKDGFKGISQRNGNILLSTGKFATPDEAADAIADQCRTLLSERKES